MRKVLIISYYWPPAGGPGSLRIVKLAQYLPSFAIRPVILTVANGEFPYLDSSLGNYLPDDIRVYHSRSLGPFSFYKLFTGKGNSEPLAVGLLTLQKKNWREKLAAFIRMNFFIPDARIGWALLSWWKAIRIIKKEKVNCIFSSSPPHSLQLLALILKKTTHVKWVADLRDPWTDIRYYQNSKRCRLSAWLDGMCEKMVLVSADHIITVSRPVGARFQNKVNGRRLKMTIVPNGYDEEEFAAIPPSLSEKFIILHTGNLLDQQNPAVLWKSIAKLAKDKPQFRKNTIIRLVGRVSPLVLESAARTGLGDLVESLSFIPHQQVIEEIKKASILLVVVPRVLHNDGIVTGKLFEYIGSARPILLIGPLDGEAGSIVAKISNSRACGYDDETLCYKFLGTNYTLWSKKHIPDSTLKERRAFSRYHQVKEIADIISQS
jgi:glycosyltransferase involved in cell wall biosynthesis